MSARLRVANNFTKFFTDWLPVIVTLLSIQICVYTSCILVYILLKECQKYEIYNSLNLPNKTLVGQKRYMAKDM